MLHPSEKTPLLIYDDQCRFCVLSKKWIERWDTKRRVQFVPFQEVNDLKGKGWDGTQMQFVEDSGAVSSGVTAFCGMLRFLPMGRFIAILFRLPGVLPLAEWVYQRIAKNRYRWFGQATKSEPTRIHKEFEAFTATSQRT